MARRRARVTVVDVLNVAGTVEARASLDAFAARGAPALRELLEALRDPPEGVRRDAHYADRDADITDLVGRLASAHPATFIAHVTEAKELLEHSSVLAAAGRVRSEATDAWIFEALSHSNQSHRWRALSILLERDDDRVAPRLRKLLRDRSSSVRFAAADGLRRWGGLEDIPELLRYQERAPPGGAARALDAIESISKRAGAPLPPCHPGERLVELDVKTAGEVREVLETKRRVCEGELLVVVDGAELCAPAAGDVIALDRGADGRLRRIVLRVER